jgi:intracellular septation protein
MSEQSNRRDGSGEPKPLLKLLIELGPLLAFFLVYWRAGFYWATGVLMVATLLSLVASWILLGRLLVMPVVTAALVAVFGGLTFYFDDPRFFMVKPTIINLGFAGVLLGGLAMRRPLLKILFGEAFNLTEEGWRKLSMRWAVFFLALAGLNEIVWRNFSQDTWVIFKAFGILALTLVFAMAQIGLIKRYEAKPGA